MGAAARCPKHPPHRSQSREHKGWCQRRSVLPIPRHRQGACSAARSTPSCTSTRVGAALPIASALHPSGVCRHSQWHSLHVRWRGHPRSRVRAPRTVAFNSSASSTALARPGFARALNFVDPAGARLASRKRRRHAAESQSNQGSPACLRRSSHRSPSSRRSQRRTWTNRLKPTIASAAGEMVPSCSKIT